MKVSFILILYSLLFLLFFLFEEINYYVTCHLIFPTISYVYIVKRVILLAVILLSLPVLVCLGLITLNS